ncbi:hypothetical protein Pmani_023708 [Petrolisthes manimaculis]|uniref:Uncharacterized protein n=1 Tax=Petrolisthes manimaculis TaxID=1843537 RepID=A0AAE1PBV7_9EUCA|nr:hypothetical protein Pmani_023708 [Petrolisthes manimaculis]
MRNTVKQAEQVREEGRGGEQSPGVFLMEDSGSSMLLAHAAEEVEGVEGEVEGGEREVEGGEGEVEGEVEGGEGEVEGVEGEVEGVEGEVEGGEGEMAGEEECMVGCHTLHGQGCKASRWGQVVQS